MSIVRIFARDIHSQSKSEEPISQIHQAASTLSPMLAANCDLQLDGDGIMQWPQPKFVTNIFSSCFLLSYCWQFHKNIRPRTTANAVVRYPNRFVDSSIEPEPESSANDVVVKIKSLVI